MFILLNSYFKFNIIIPKEKIYLSNVSKFQEIFDKWISKQNYKNNIIFLYTYE